MNTNKIIAKAVSLLNKIRQSRYPDNIIEMIRIILFVGHNIHKIHKYNKPRKDKYQEVNNLKVYTYCTSAYKVLIKNWFYPTASVEYDIIVKGIDKKTDVIKYFSNGWADVTGNKVEMLIAIIKTNAEEAFIYSDPDIQFLGKTKKDLIARIKNKDILFQRDDPKGLACTGFFVCRCNSKTLKFWQDVRKDIKNTDDQVSANKLLMNTSYVPMYFQELFRNRLNPYEISWDYLPDKYISGGTLTGRLWSPGTELPIVPGIVLHHANWTVGLENKIAQLRHVKNKVSDRKKMIS